MWICTGFYSVVFFVLGKSLKSLARGTRLQIQAKKKMFFIGLFSAGLSEEPSN